MKPDSSPLTRDMIDRPDLWRLAMRVDDAVHVLLYSAVSPDGLVYRAFPLDQSSPSRLKAIEEIIYSNDVLVSDFDRIDFLTDTPSTLTVPYECNFDQASYLLASTVYGDPERKELPSTLTPAVLYSTTASNASVVSAMDIETEAFLRRTFYDIHITPSIAVLINYFAKLNAGGNSRRMYATFHCKDVTLLVFDRNRLIHAVKVKCSGANDAAYFIMAVRNLLQLAPDTDPVILAGESPLREDTASIIRKFVHQVLPAIFPSDLLMMGRDAMRLPFDLTAAILTTRK